MPITQGVNALLGARARHCGHGGDGDPFAKRWKAFSNICIVKYTNNKEF